MSAPARYGADVAEPSRWAAPESWLPTLALALLVVALWEATIRLFHVSSFIVPAPSAIVAAMIREARPLAAAAIVTAEEILVGFVAAAAVGIVLALIIARFRLFGRALYPLVVLFQNVPKVALAPIFILWFGYDLTPKVGLIVVIAFFPVTLSILTGIEAVEPSLIALMHSVGAQPNEILAQNSDTARPSQPDGRPQDRRNFQCDRRNRGGIRRRVGGARLYDSVRLDPARHRPRVCSARRRLRGRCRLLLPCRISRKAHCPLGAEIYSVVNRGALGRRAAGGEKRMFAGKFVKTAAALIFAAIGCTVQAAAAADQVSVQLDWVVRGNHAMFFVGKEKGFFAKNGIDLTDIRKGSGSPDAMRLVGNGNADFGFGDLPTLAVARAQNVPVVALAAVNQHSPLAMVTLAKTKVLKSPADLKGLNIGIHPAGSTYIFFKALLAANGLTEADMKISSVAPPYESYLLLGRVDAVVGYIDAEVPELEAKAGGSGGAQHPARRRLWLESLRLRPLHVRGDDQGQARPRETLRQGLWRGVRLRHRPSR